MAACPDRKTMTKALVYETQKSFFSVFSLTGKPESCIVKCESIPQEEKSRKTAYRVGNWVCILVPFMNTNVFDHFCVGCSHQH